VGFLHTGQIEHVHNERGIQRDFREKDDFMRAQYWGLEHRRRKAIRNCIIVVNITDPDTHAISLSRYDKFLSHSISSVHKILTRYHFEKARGST
jgi:CO dehydrogenase nickel-insertion accessory protein CooC1